MATKNGWDGIRARVERATPNATPHTDGVRQALDWFERRMGVGWPGWRARHPFAGQFLLTYGHAEPDGVRLFRLATLFNDGQALDDVVSRLGGRDWGPTTLQ